MITDKMFDIVLSIDFIDTHHNALEAFEVSRGGVGHGPVCACIYTVITSFY